MRAVLLIALALLLVSAAPADAGPLAGVLAAVGTAFTTAFTAQALLGALVRTALSVGLSLLLQKKQQKQRSAGIQTNYTTSGGTDPQGTIVGWYATGGHLVYRNSHGPNNRYLTHVVEVSDLPGVTLSRVIIDGEYSDLGGTPHADFGYPILSKQDAVGNDRAWIRFIDGTHTAADAKLVELYGEDPDRPWTANHILTGIAHAILTFDLHRPVYPDGVPKVRFELNGIPLYDPRADSLVGGSGTQRWADPSTWEATTNPIVIAYNIHRGITLPCGAVWGGGAEAEDLPLESWTVAMNACDTLVGANNRPQFRAGFEIRFSDEPAEILEELYAAANAQVAELGGRWRVQVGAPAAALVSVTDDDLLVSESRQREPFPGLEETFNAISVTHPSPNALWNAAQPATIENAEWEAEDGTQRLFELRLPAVPWAAQARQVAKNMIRDERRFRRHGASLPPEYFWLEPLDTLAWTSDWNDYTGKDFEVSEVAYDLRTLVTAISLRERDPSDFGHVAELELPDPPRVTAKVTITDAGVPGFAVTAITLTDGGAADRRAAIRAIWDPSLDDTARGIAFQVRIAGQTDLALSASTGDLEAGEAILAPLLPGQDYEVRAKARARKRKTSWTGWLPVTTQDVRLGSVDLDNALTSAEIPTGLSLSTSLLSDGLARVAATWNAASGAVAYEVGVTQSGGSEVVLTSGDTTKHIDGLPGLIYAIRVRSVSAIGSKSAWTTAENITSAADSTPPAVPLNPTAEGGFNAVWVEWDAVGDADLSHYEVCVKDSTTPPGVNPTSPLYRAGGTAFVHFGLGDAVTKYYFVRAVDTSGNKSGWSVVASATTFDAGLTAVTTEDIQGVVDATSFASGLSAVGVVGALPADNSDYDTVLLTTDDKLYRWDGSAWTRAIDGADLVANSVTTGAVSAGAIKAEQLDVGAVTARAVGIGDFTNFVAGSSGNWENHPWTILEGNTVLVTNGDHTGQSEKALNFWGSGTIYRAEIDRVIDVTVGEEIYIEFWVLVSSDFDGDANSKLRIGHGDTNDPITQISFNGYAGAGWTKLTGTYTVAAGVKSLKVQLWSTNTVGYARVDDMIIRKKNGGELIVDGGIKANHVGTNEVIANLANIKDALITDAKIASLSAAKLLAGTALTSSLTVNGTALSTIDSRAADPATVINNGVTQIDPGLVVISAGTSLADWRKGGDLTKIDGGALSANTVETNKLTIGNRGISVQNVKFEVDTSANAVKWTSGYVRYVADNGSSTSRSVAAGSIAYTGVRIYVYFTKGSTDLRGSSDPTLAGTGDNVILATFNGGTDLTVNFGQTVIDGDHIKTGTVEAQHVKTGTLTADQLSARTITADKFVLTDQVNFLDGGDMEDDSRIPWDTSLTGYGIATNNYYTGTQSFRIATNAPTVNPLKVDTIPVLPGDRFKLTGWGKRSADFDGDANFKVRISQGDYTAISHLSYNSWAGNNSWAYLDHEFVIPSGVTELRVDLWAGSGTTGYVYLDDFRLRKMTDGALLDGSVSVTTAFTKTSDEEITSENSWTQVLTSGSATYKGSKPLMLLGMMLFWYNFTISGGRIAWKYRIKNDGSVVYTSPLFRVDSAGSSRVGIPMTYSVPVGFKTSSEAGSAACTIEVYIDATETTCPLGAYDFYVLNGSSLAAFELKV